MAPKPQKTYLYYIFLLGVYNPDDSGRNIQMDVSRGKGEHMDWRHRDSAQWAVNK